MTSRRGERILGYQEASAPQYLGLSFKELEDQLKGSGYSRSEYKGDYIYRKALHEVQVSVDFNTHKVFLAKQRWHNQPRTVGVLD